MDSESFYPLPDESTSHLTNSAKNAEQVIGYNPPPLIGGGDDE